MEKERLAFLVLFIFAGCASHHTKGRVLHRLGPGQGVMLVESDSVSASDRLRIVRSICHIGVRGNLVCFNQQIGGAVVESNPVNGEASFRAPASVDFRRGDLLEPQER